ncbi:hypothetical protein [Natrinema ejinorense]|uniref:Uncharacterized protein n=1 Tax=Natrinema ejinorense TaxID=373386 RepID=A0A2A5QYC3_9EURY|nr:hypothetical protein [Natrinema ejinorense]PCR91832.1 hypothetical protein CP557_15655 [Natrinema ejinorense]
MVAQAREYAKWHVYRERESDTLPPRRNPDRIAATLATLREMDDGEFERHFGTLVQQFSSYGDDTVDRPIELEDVRGYHEEIADGVDDFATAVIGRLQEVGVFGTLGDQLSELLGNDGSDDADSQPVEVSSPEYFRQFGPDHISEPYYMYHRDDQPDRTVGRVANLDREPDTVIEMYPVYFDTEAEIDGHIYY